jgi:zinc protease
MPNSKDRLKFAAAAAALSFSLSGPFAGSLLAAQQKAPVLKATHQVTPELKTEEYQLENGLTVFLTPNKKAPSVSIIHWVHAGSLHETPGITGIAHLFEHMMFRPLSAKEDDFSTKMKKLGADFNANTRFESTVYTTSVPEKHLNAALKVESERFQNLTVTKDLLDTERKAVWSEYSTKMDANPIFDLWYTLYTAAFPKHPLGWMIIGFREDLEKITAEDCNKFFKTFYRPNNTGLFISGNFDSKATIAEVQKNYGKWEKGTNSVLPDPFKHDNKFVSKEGVLTSKTLSYIAAYRTPLLNKDNYDVQQLVNHIFFKSKFSLAKRRFVHDKKIAADASDWNFSYDNGMLRLYLNMLPGATAELVVSETSALVEDFKKLSDQEYNAYAKELQIDAGESLQRNVVSNMELALYWGKSGGPASLQHLVSGKTQIARAVVESFIGEYFKKENLVVVSNKAEKSSH